MSKLRTTIFLFAFAAAGLFLSSVDAAAQSFEAKIEIESLSPAIVKISGRYLDAGRTPDSKNFSFLKNYAGAENLAARVSDVRLADRGGQNISYKKLAEGEYLADAAIESFDYRVNFSAANKMSAHVSWITETQGILMPRDLLPETNGQTFARLEFAVPKEWKISTAEKRIAERIFETADSEKSVFFTGKNFRKNEIRLGNSKINLVTGGEFLFSDDEAVKAVDDIFALNKRLFGAPARETLQILIVRLPADAKNGRWEAETRGATVTILSADMAFKNQSFQRLHEQLRHEIFHFWMPNSLNLSGNYDWFYEGFALYQALRAGVELNKLRFEDFLDTLARAHSIDTLQTQRISLVEASQNRWNGANTQIYARGMLVAFLIDLAILRASKGKKSLAEPLGEIYRKHSYANPRAEGNSAVLQILQNYRELDPIIKKYVAGAETIRWQTDLEAAGIEAVAENFTTKLTVKSKLNGRQKDLLDKLGYNNWRKLSQNTK